MSAEAVCVVVMPMTRIPAARAASMPAGASSHDDTRPRGRPEQPRSRQVALGIGLAGGDLVAAHHHDGHRQPHRAKAALRELAMTRRDDSPTARGQARQRLGRTPHDLEALAVGLLRGVEQRGLGFGVDVRGDGAEDIGAAHAVQDGEHGREVEPEALAQTPPLPLDDGARVDERAVEVEEERRHTRIRAASRTTPNTASSTSPRSSPSVCSGNGLAQVTRTSSTSCR